MSIPIPRFAPVSRIDPLEVDIMKSRRCFKGLSSVHHEAESRTERGSRSFAYLYTLSEFHQMWRCQ